MIMPRVSKYIPKSAAINTSLGRNKAVSIITIKINDKKKNNETNSLFFIFNIHF
jgi:hypothetical protein